MQLMIPALRPVAFGIVACVDFVERMLASSGSLYKVLLIPGFERLRWRIGVWRAWRTFYRTYRDVPAYRQFIAAHGGRPRIPLTDNFLPDLRAIPEIDKESYVKKFPLEQRVRGGALPVKGVMVDESSGSSGQPTSWVRGAIERRITSQMMRLSYRNSVQKGDRVFILNAFALGAWATGMNVSISLTDTSILKSTGPNADKIINTMKEFGPSFRYVIMGYPPFLKTLADDSRIDWSAFTVDAGYGGEGISESLRSYLLTKFKQVVGSYGASDLEVNMAIETELTIRLRRALLSDARLRAALIRTDYGVTPMIFPVQPAGLSAPDQREGRARRHHFAAVQHLTQDPLQYPRSWPCADVRRAQAKACRGGPAGHSRRHRAEDRLAASVHLRPIRHVNRVLWRKGHARQHPRNTIRRERAHPDPEHIPADVLRGQQPQQAHGDRSRIGKGRDAIGRHHDSRELCLPSAGRDQRRLLQRHVQNRDC